ncbi:MAG TPA: glutaminyl-peptide cyclotransferase [candidate division Zixibacteria bacterium]|nr:glutaminyl-peptide cyclotransferase [candidate division Zixibacteria bacterium]MDM7974332.1 glutaminyl-peptide cyclotransferase [candidate division Zixibacteria bacterium]HOD66344.1 glutaminyl-peptide cyclotransferase [candidate division Zixibacteria bacterium]HOZ07641.1 glutaminyl-peptide cyclotransferase [candidate division Zixibacteria bacterium]HPC10576.1 glutaminyl-peptide cyclotransferase [candidate division Zixibacteria bacterium]
MTAGPGRPLRGAVIAALLAVLPAACGSSQKQPAPPAKIAAYRVKVIRTYPHDSLAFTQGLAYEGGYLYEGTGKPGASSVRRVRLETGAVLQRRDLPAPHFGEGIALVGDRLVQLTWTSRTGFVYDRATLAPLSEFRYLTEGWGLTYDGIRLIMSDGSATLQLLDPQTYEYCSFLAVRADGEPVERLNELEYVDGEIFANVWPGDRIARISAATGQVTGWIDASGLLAPEDYGDSTDVLNGIAWDAEHRRLFLTGKCWPKLFEVELEPVE